MKRRKSFVFIGCLVVTGVFFFLLGMSSHPDRGKAEEATPAATLVIKDETGFMNVISEVAEALMPTVVHLDVTGTVTQRSPGFGSPFGDDPFFRYFFGPPQEREYTVPIQALGSGVIISKEGYIITNNHVVQNADTIEVELYDGTEQRAKLIGTDPRTDLAVVKIDPSPEMKYAKFGNSDKVKVGEWVIAIGSPRGLDWTVTAGIISAKNRSNIGVLGPTGFEDFIQTDAAINPGNSGGPLINLEGEVIGVNALIVSASQGSEGLGFAVPSNMAMAISDSLIKRGKVVRGYLGVSIQDVTSDMAKSMNLEKGFKGVIIADVGPNTPASKAGIQQGDIVIKYNGERIEGVSQFRNLVAATEPKTIATLTVLRNGKELDIEVKIGELEEIEEQAKAKESSEPLGLTVEKVTPDIARDLGLRSSSGVIVTRVEQGSAADRARIERGDIIYRVGNRAANEPEEFSALVAEASKEGKVMLLLRDGRTGNVGYIIVPVR